ncbi:MAG TPA: cytochrome c3 family protein [bacterium]|nr:cytochrome c3 family protein [bacterium]HMW35290.1 cytochrome c3 family protein [bacterium]HMY35843.1 cytochrome c3 family protein [bacterium]HMZ04678.1 cytochrome c3 family protein [bacterium]HNB10715.1 cytochrome c3 family protein [bacterium]
MKMNSFLILMFWTVMVFGQKNNPLHNKTNLPCKTCHTCEFPTIKDPCLIDCPRENLITIRASVYSAPEFIQLNRLSDRYAGVRFSHKRHAEMYDMSGGCGGCHHYNTSGPVQSCAACHALKNENKPDKPESTPGLQAAYHRQCITCHKTWSAEAGCNSCHDLKKSVVSQSEKNKKDSLLAISHRTRKEPEKIVYETDTDKGRIATFYHKDHTQLFGVSCGQCHSQLSCVKCHDQKRSMNEPLVQNVINKTEEEKHAACFNCHKDDNCTKCHSNKELQPFDHGTRTGWPLANYHTRLICSNCHGANKNFKGLSRECNTCHTAWTMTTFRHAVTGLVLSEDHLELSCKDCHQKNKYTTKPVCMPCHDDKTYPNDLPGRKLW